MEDHGLVKREKMEIERTIGNEWSEWRGSRSRLLIRQSRRKDRGWCRLVLEMIGYIDTDNKKCLYKKVKYNRRRGRLMETDWDGNGGSSTIKSKKKDWLQDSAAETGEVCTHTHSRVGRYYTSSSELGLAMVSRPAKHQPKSGNPIVVVEFAIISSATPNPQIQDSTRNGHRPELARN
ncbi:hypothetical protein BDN70DRAFT_889433 [Pholiota conissans]|uniref:Uncharacterized protein n=1 Tax=Pholiota conissans TaxID=109636 RepID=A0A9P6D7D4_9AGAR|nr:hypothetical protein BDN70DRAFT_889433 [Pholiota conissans]